MRVILLSLILLTGCSPDFYEVVKTDDPFTRVQTVEMVRNATKNDRVYFNVKRELNPALKDTSYWIETYFYSRDWVFLEDRPLMLLLDGQRLDLVGQIFRDAGEIVVEGITCRTTPDELRAIASATTVRGRMVGERGNVEFVLSAKNKQRILQFLTL